MKRIVILHLNKLPSFISWDVPDIDELIADDHLLVKAFDDHGYEATAVPWKQPGIDWNTFDAAIIRSTWDYIDNKKHFLDVLSQIERSSCKLFNPLDAVRWNIDKNYLFELEKNGMPIIPTYSISDFDLDTLQEKLAQGKWETAILKPMLGGGGVNLQRVAVKELAETIRQLIEKRTAHQYMLQPFIDSVITEGEWSFIFFNHKLNHAILKKPKDNDYRVQSIYGGIAEVTPPLPEDIPQVTAIMEHLPFDLLYARFDMVRVNEKLAVMEVELIEPVLSLQFVPDAASKLVKATEALLSSKRQLRQHP